MFRLAPALITASLGAVGLGLLGQHVQREYDRRERVVEIEAGRRLYWQVRRTVHVHEPYELLNQLHARAENADAVLAVLKLNPGEVVADVGCGAGFYTLDLAERVGPRGRVLGLDIQPESLVFLEERIASKGCQDCGNIELVHSRIDDPILPEASLDAMLMAHLDFYAYRPLLPENETMIERSAAALRPGGRLVVVQDMRPVPGGNEEAIVANFEEAGLAPDLVADFEDGTVLATFRKR